MASSNTAKTLEKAYRSARAVSFIAFVVSALCLSAACLMLVLIVLACFKSVGTANFVMQNWLLDFINNIANILFIFLVTRFLWFFWRGQEPLAEAQIRRLLASTVCQIMAVVTAMLARTFKNIVLIHGPVPIALVNDAGPRISLTNIVYIFLFISIIFILRYAKALKEDCDSIV